MSKHEQLISKVYTHGYNNLDEQLSVYEPWSEHYDQSMITDGVWTGPGKAAGYVMLNYPWDCAIADIGCGTGIVGKILKTSNYLNVDGYDVSQGMMDHAIAHYKTVKFCNIAETPLPKQYDVITATGVFTRGHVDATAVPNVIKSLKPGGELVVTFPVLEDYDYEVEAGWSLQDQLKATHRQKFDSYTSNGKRLQHELIIYKSMEIS
jgi:predicted TPR repeat methyltransferase